MTTKTTKIEYRVRPVTRYIVTRYEASESGEGVEQRGEFPNLETAYAVGYALCRQEHDRLGWPVGDERIIYPEATVLPGFEPVSAA